MELSRSGGTSSPPHRNAYLKGRAKYLYRIGDDSEAYLIDKAQVSVWPVPADIVGVIDQVLAFARQLPEDAGAWDDLAPVVSSLIHRPTAFPAAFVFLESELEDEAPADEGAGSTLPKLAINVANDCNLACTYCYANEGLYASEAGMLSATAGAGYAKKFAAAYTDIGQVQFMGGEPTMNLAAMRAVAETFERAVENGSLNKRPEYQIVTNGVKFSPQFLDFCQRYAVQLTISLDGPKEVHDCSRPRRDGRGSYSLVVRSIEAAREAGITFGFEPTFSRAHLRHGMSLTDLCQWFFDEYSVRVLHAPPMSQNRYVDPAADMGLTIEEKVEQFCSVSRWGIANLLVRGEVLLHDYTARVLVSLAAQRRNDHLCPAGNSQLSVSMSGELSPCWMFTDEPEYSLGNLSSTASVLEDAGRVRLDELDKLDLHSHPICSACAIQPVCFGCKGGDFHESGSVAGKPNCDYMRAMVATCISEVVGAGHLVGAESQLGSGPRRTLGERIWQQMVPDISIPAQDVSAPRVVMLPTPTLRRG